MGGGVGCDERGLDCGDDAQEFLASTLTVACDFEIHEGEGGVEILVLGQFGGVAKTVWPIEDWFLTFHVLVETALDILTNEPSDWPCDEVLAIERDRCVLEDGSGMPDVDIVLGTIACEVTPGDGSADDEFDGGGGVRDLEY